MIAPLEAQTLMRVNADEFSFADILQMVTLTRTRFRIDVFAATGVMLGSVETQGGMVLKATHQNESGELAFYHLCNNSINAFFDSYTLKNDPTENPSQNETPLGSVVHLLLNALTQKEQANNMKSEVFVPIAKVEAAQPVEGTPQLEPSSPEKLQRDPAPAKSSYTPPQPSSASVETVTVNINVVYGLLALLALVFLALFSRNRR